MEVTRAFGRTMVKERKGSFCKAVYAVFLMVPISRVTGSCLHLTQLACETSSSRDTRLLLQAPALPFVRLALARVEL
jgi:hypothetical protein